MRGELLVINAEDLQKSLSKEDDTMKKIASGFNKKLLGDLTKNK